VAVSRNGSDEKILSLSPDSPLRSMPLCALRNLSENDECPFCILPDGPYALKKENNH